MPLSRTMPLTRTLPLMIVGFATAACAAFGVGGYLMAKSAVMQEVSERFSTIAESREDMLTTWINGVGSDMVLLAESPAIHNAMRQLSRGWLYEGEGGAGELQRAYIEDNPNPVGQKHLLDSAERGEMYDRAHAQYHPWLRGHLEQKGFYDLFLFDPEGNLIYSVFKENDFATNLINGPYAASGLGQAVQAAATMPAGEVVFIDFTPYAPSFDAPASFMATPILSDAGDRVGTLAVQLPIDRMNSVMNRTGAATGDPTTYLVGTDGLARSAPGAEYGIEILTTRLESAAIRQALEGEATIIHNTLSPKDVRVVQFVRPLSIYGVDWVLVVEQERSVIKAALTKMLISFIIGFAVVTALIMLAGCWIAKDIAAPIRRLSDSMKQVASGELDIEIDGRERADEIGRMANALADVASKLTRAESAIAVAERDERVSTARSSTAPCDDMASTHELMEASLIAMQTIQGTISEITTALGLIEAITVQTNLLRLNAGVEAGWVGDAGERFIVVATEARALAQRNSDAEGEIRALIDWGDARMEPDASRSEDAGNMITLASRSIGLLNESITAMSRTAQEQSSALLAVSNGMRELYAAQANGGIPEDIRAICHTLSDCAAELSSTVASFTDWSASTDSAA